MQTDIAEQRRQAHCLIDVLTEEKLKAMHQLLEVLVEPMVRTLALAPIEEEEINEQTAAEIDEARASLARGEGVSHEDILKEFGVPQEEPKQSVGFLQGLRELRGLGKEIWRNVDPDEYVNSLRENWGETMDHILTQSQLIELIPAQLPAFAKLEGGPPYQFLRWAMDTSGAKCLYYSFPSKKGGKDNRKRIPVSELLEAMSHFAPTGRMSRSDFARCCPVADSAGHCGFVVVGRILETFTGAAYGGRKLGFFRPS